MKKGFSSLIAILFSIILTIVVAGVFFYWYTGVQTLNQDLVFNSFSQTQAGIITETELLFESLYTTEEEDDPNGLADFTHTICNTGKTTIDLSARRSVIIKESDSENLICKIDDFSNQCFNSTRYLVAGLSFDNVPIGEAESPPSIIYSTDGVNWTEAGGFVDEETVWEFVQYAVESGGGAPDNIFTAINTTFNGEPRGRVGWSEDANDWKFRTLSMDNGSVPAYSATVDPISNTLYLGTNRNNSFGGAQILKVVPNTVDNIINFSIVNLTSVPSDSSIDFDGVFALFANGSVFLAGTGKTAGDGGTVFGQIYRSTNSDWNGLNSQTLPASYLRVNDFEQVGSRIYASTTGDSSLGGSPSDVIYSDDGGITWTSTSLAATAFSPGITALLDDPANTGSEVYALRSDKSVPSSSLVKYNGASWSTIQTWSTATTYDITVDDNTGYFYVALRNESLTANGSEVWRSGPNFNDANWTRVYSNTIRGAGTALGVFDVCTQRNPTCIEGCTGTLSPGECKNVRLVLEKTTCDLIPNNYGCMQFYTSLGGTTTKEDYYEFCRDQDPGDQDIINHDSGFTGSGGGYGGGGGGTPPIPGANRIPFISSKQLSFLPPTANSTYNDLFLTASVVDSDGDNTTIIRDWRVNGTSVALLNMPFDHYSLNVLDYSVFGKTGSNTNLNWQNVAACGLSSAAGGCYDFTGTNSYVDVGTVSLGSHPTDVNMTVSMWIRPDVLSGDTTFLSYNGDVAGGFRFYWNSANSKLTFSYDGTDIFEQSAGSLTATGTWSYVGVSIQNGLPTNFFLNISPTVHSTWSASRVLGSGTFSPSTTGDLEIGRRTDTTNQYFDGEIDDVAIYNRTFSSTQIARIFASEGNGFNRLISENTKLHDAWRVYLTPNDGSRVPFGTGGDGNTVSTNEAVVLNIPTSDLPLLRSSAYPYFNTSIQNYTAFNRSFNDLEGKSLIAVYDWRTNTTIGGSGVSIAPLNLHFETESLSDIEDYSTYDNTVTVSGATWQDKSACHGGGAFTGACYRFTSSADRITVTDSTAFDTDNMSVALWFTPTINYGIGTGAFLIGKDDGGTTNGNWKLYIDSADGKLKFRLTDGASSSTVSSFTSWSSGSTYYVTAGYDENSDEMFMYVGRSDGAKAEEAATTFPGVSIASNTQNIYIGSSPDVSGYFQGYLDGVQVYDRIVTFDQFNSVANYTSQYTAVYNYSVSGMTKGGNILTVGVTPNNAVREGETKTASITVDPETAPTQDPPFLFSTDSTLNDTFQDLIAYNQSFVDAEGDALTAIYDWRVNTTTGAPGDPESIALINMPLDTYTTHSTRDYSTNKRNGSLMGGDVVWTRGSSCISGGCFDFPGTAGDYLELPIPSGYISEDFTLSLWVEPDSSSGPIIYAHGPSNAVFRLSLQVGFFDFDGNGVPSVEAPITLSTIQAHPQFLVVTYNSTSSTAKMYLNGSLTDTNTISIGAITEDLPIGGILGFSTTWDGTMDELKIFNRALSDEQVAAMYNTTTNTSTYNITHSEETRARENWTITVTPNDGLLDGPVRNDSILILGNEPPIHNSPVLNATSSWNSTYDDLNVYNRSFFDLEGDSFVAIYDWRVNFTPSDPANRSVAVLNMPFYTNTTSLTAKAVKDYSTFRNNGTLGGGTLANAPYWKNATHCGLPEAGGCYTFDGSDDYIEVPHDTSITPINSNWTVVSWFNPDIALATEGVLVSKTDGSDGWYLRYFPSGNQVTGYICSSSCSPVAVSSVPAGAWHMAVLTYQEDTNGAILYVDGTASPPASPAYQAAGNDISIGRKSFTPFYPFEGNISSVMIYNRTLSPEQITAMYNSGAPRFNIIVPEETTEGENYTVAVTPTDGYNDGKTKISNAIILVGEVPPTHDTPVLNSSNPLTNFTQENLTVYPQNVENLGGGSLTLIYDWRINTTVGAPGTPQSIALINLPFDIENSTGVKDYSLYDNEGTVSGATWTNPTTCGLPGGGGCYDFDGGSNYIDFGSFAGQTLSDPTGSSITWEAWINPNNHGSTGVIMDSGGFYGSRGISMTIASTEYVYCWIQGAALGMNQFSLSAVSTGNWHHVVCQYNVTSNLARLYVDGSLHRSAPAGSTVHTETITDFVVGTYAPAKGTWGFDGLIDNVRVYDRALSEDQIVANYNSGSPKYNITLSNETARSDNWTVAVTPTNTILEGETKVASLLVEPEILRFSGDIPSRYVDLIAVHSGPPTATASVYDWRANGSIGTNVSIAYVNYPFDVSGSPTYDYSSYQRSGSISGAVHYSGCGTSPTSAGCYRYDGINDYASLGATNPSGGFTTSFWVYKTTSSNLCRPDQTLSYSTRCPIASRLSSGPRGWGIFWNEATNGIEFEVCNGSSCSPPLTPTSCTSLTGNRWVFVTFDIGGTHYARCDAGSLYSSSSPYTSPAVNIELATSNILYPNDHFNGYIENFVMYNRILTSGQRANIYLGGPSSHDNIDVNEVAPGQSWTVKVTDTNPSADVAEVLSNQITIP